MLEFLTLEKDLLIGEIVGMLVAYPLGNETWETLIDSIQA